MRTLFLSLFLILLSGCGSSTGSGKETDPLYGYAWHLHSASEGFAETFGIDPDAHIHLGDSWMRTQGEGVTIAVLDDYFEPDHPDLRANVVLTYNAQTGTADVSAPADTLPHGQFCAGTAAAASNAVGVVGVAPKAKLILIGSVYNGSDADIIRAFEFARSHGADVISCSWGSYMVSQAVADEIQSVHDANITIVFAAGNDGYDMDGTDRARQEIQDESELPWVIGVTASSEYNDRAYYANYGSAIDLMAPGGEAVGIPTTDLSGPAGSSPDNLYASTYLGEDYTFFNGTSAAAPIVAGAAALLKSFDPSLTPDQVREVLIETADKIGGSSLYDPNGFSLTHAYGKLNISQALETLQH